MVEPAEYEARALYDPDAPDADERLMLLDELVALGATLDEIAFAQDVMHVAYVPVLIRLRAQELTSIEVAERLGVEPEEIEAAWRWFGLPPPDHGRRCFGERDVDMLESFVRVETSIGREGGSQLGRALGASCARIAESAIAAFTETIRRDDVDTGGTALEKARFNARAIEDLDEAAAHIDVLLGHHLRAGLERWIVAGEGRDDDQVRFAVGFVDLVGYTPLSNQLAPAELAALVDRLETTALDAVTAHNGRVVKLVGDEVMFVALDASAACDVGMRLLEAFDERSGDVSPRGGVAIGTVLAREGDFYGPPVNLASRIADQAVPGELLVTDEIVGDVTAVEGPFRFEPAGRRMLKGFEQPVALRTVARA